MVRALLVTVVVSLGCVAAPGNATSQDDLAAATGYPNDQAAYDYFVTQGLSSFQAAGIVGNLDVESGVDPTIAQYGGGPGRGIAQWSVGARWDTTSNDNVVAYAAQQGASATSLDLQLGFIWYELTTLGYGDADLIATTNVTDATKVFMSEYEICGSCDSTDRVADANAVLAAYGDTTPGSGSGSGSGGGSGSSMAPAMENAIGNCSTGNGSGGVLVIAIVLGGVVRRRRHR